MREKFRNRSRTGERASERRRWRGWNLLPSPLPSFPTLQQNHKSADIASCCIREATRRHTPSSSGLLPFPRPVPSPDDDPFPTPPSPLPVCTRVLRSTSVTAFRSASLEGLADQPTPSHQPPFPFHP